MSKNIYNIGNRLVNIACLQTRPGQEFSVIEKFRLRVGSTSHNLGCFKGFGQWDIFVIEETDRESDGLLNKAGNINHILNSIEIKAFIYSSSLDNSAIFNTIMGKTYAALTFVKIDHANMDAFDDIEHNLQSKNIEYIILGETGWCEAIILTYGEKIIPIVQAWHGLNILKSGSNIVKTFTQLLINYQALQECRAYLTNHDELKTWLSKQQNFNENIGHDIFTSISIAASPKAYTKILAYWRTCSDYELSAIYGYADIRIRQKVGTSISMANFLSDLLFFRNAYSNAIIHTSTNVMWLIDFQNEGVTINAGESAELQDAHRQCDSTSFLSEENIAILQKYLPETIADEMECQLQIYHDKRDHPLAGQCLRSLDNYIESIFLRLSEIQNEPKEIAPNKMYSEFKNLPDVLAKAIELRTAGSAFTYTQSSSAMSRVAGGVQQCIDAIELIPFMICANFEYLFDGFVLTPYPGYAHYHGALLMPLKDIFTPEKWWCLYHEIGHYFVIRTKILDKENTQVKGYISLSINDSIKPALELFLQEIAADIVGYSIATSRDFDLYDTLNWEYFFENEIIDKSATSIESISKNMLRNFCIKIYDDMNKKALNYVPSGSLEDLRRSIIPIYAKYIKNTLDLVKNTVILDDDEKKVFLNIEPTLLASIHSTLLTKIIPILYILQDNISTMLPSLNPPSPEQQKEAQAQAALLMKGKICETVIMDPVSVLHEILLKIYHTKDGVAKRPMKLDFRQRLAIIVSFSRSKWSITPCFN